MSEANNLIGNWNYPTAMRFGAGRITELADCCKALGMSNPLLVTDPGLAALPMIGEAMENVKDRRPGCGALFQYQRQPDRPGMWPMVPRPLMKATMMA